MNRRPSVERRRKRAFLSVPDDLDTRIGWLLDLITGAQSELLTRLWHPATFDTLAVGRDSDGRELPKHGHVASARLDWTPTYPDGCYIPSRVTQWHLPTLTLDGRGGLLRCAATEAVPACDVAAGSIVASGSKLARLQEEGQLLHRNAARLCRLAENAPQQVRAELEAKIAVLEENRTAVGAKRGRINREPAFHFACQPTMRPRPRRR